MLISNDMLTKEEKIMLMNFSYQQSIENYIDFSILIISKELHLHASTSSLELIIYVQFIDFLWPLL